jgi:hypothetical protein
MALTGKYKLGHPEKGFGLIEVLVGSTLIALVGVAILGGLTLGVNLLTRTDTSETAKDLAVTQMEYIKSTYWSDISYSVLADNLTLPSGYSIPPVTPVSLNDGNLQKITVIVEQNNREVFRLEDYKVR